MTIESEEIKGKANLLRFFISRYDTYLRFHYPPNEPLPSQQPIAWEEPDKNLPIYLTPRDELVWEKLIREGYVNNYSQLGTRALQHAQKLTETRVKRAKNRFQEWQQLNSLHSLFEEINHA